MRSVPAMIDGVKSLLLAGSSPDATAVQRLDSKMSMQGGKTASKDDDEDVAMEERPGAKNDINDVGENKGFSLRIHKNKS